MISIICPVLNGTKIKKLQKSAITLRATDGLYQEFGNVLQKIEVHNCQGDFYGNVNSLKKKRNCGRKYEDYGEQLERRLLTEEAPQDQLLTSLLKFPNLHYYMKF